MYQIGISPNYRHLNDENFTTAVEIDLTAEKDVVQIYVVYMAKGGCACEHGVPLPLLYLYFKDHDGLRFSPNLTFRIPWAEQFGPTGHQLNSFLMNTTVLRLKHTTGIQTNGRCTCTNFIDASLQRNRYEDFTGKSLSLRT